MSESFEYIPLGVEPDDTFDDLVDQVVVDMSPAGQELDMAVQDLATVSDLLDESLVIVHHSTNEEDNQELLDQIDRVLDSFGLLAELLGPDDISVTSAADRFALAKLIASLTYDRAKLLQAITGIDLFINLTEEHMTEDIMLNLCQTEDGQTLGMAALDIFDTLLSDQSEHFERLPVAITPVRPVNAVRRLAHLFPGYHRS